MIPVSQRKKVKHAIYTGFSFSFSFADPAQISVNGAFNFLSTVFKRTNNLTV
jgi:hypothetical protein